MKLNQDVENQEIEFEKKLKDLENEGNKLKETAVNYVQDIDRLEEENK